MHLPAVPQTVSDPWPLECARARARGLFMDPIDFWLFSAKGCHTKTELPAESLQPWLCLSKKNHTFCWMFVCFVCFHKFFSYSFQICFCKEFLQTCYKYWCVGVHPRTNTPHALIYKCQACFPSVSDWALEIAHWQLLQATLLLSMVNFWMAHTLKRRSFPTLEVSRFSSCRWNPAGPSG